MAIKVLPIAPEDARILVPMGFAAFATDAMNIRVFDPSNKTSAQIAEHLAWRTERFKHRSTGPGKFFFKAVDEESGAVTGSVGLYSPEATKKTPAALVPAAAQEAEEEGLKLPASTPKETVEFFEMLEKKMEGLKKEVLGERGDFWCEFPFYYFLLGARRYGTYQSLLHYQIFPPLQYTQTTKVEASANYC
jgi:hypothetical protein